jgi:hypothetical protein
VTFSFPRYENAVTGRKNQGCSGNPIQITGCAGKHQEKKVPEMLPAVREALVLVYKLHMELL